MTFLLTISFCLLAVVLSKQTSMVDTMKVGLPLVSVAVMWAGERAGRRGRD